jgi:hypothetical protein
MASTMLMLIKACHRRKDCATLLSGRQITLTTTGTGSTERSGIAPQHAHACRGRRSVRLDRLIDTIVPSRGINL